MKAENTTTDHNRTIRFMDLVGHRGEPMTGMDGKTELQVSLHYVRENNAYDGVALDNAVIPAIIKAVNQEPAEQKYPIGTRFKLRGKHYVSTVTDFLVTRNLAGKVVHCEYEATHEYLGQTVTSKITGTSIAMGGVE